MKCGLCLLVLPVLFSMLAYRYIQFMPEGAKEPVNQMKTLAMIRISDDIIWFLSLFGYSEIGLRRSMFEAAPRPSNDSRIESVDEYFDGVKVRIYRPKSAKDKILPALVFYHGGGWKYFSIDSYDPLTRNISLQADIVVVSVEYHLMPEHRFPVPFEDCVKATEYFFQNAKSYHVDPLRIGIAGDSAGGNLAAAVAIKFSKDPKPGLPKLKLQILLYPVLQAFDFSLPSYQEHPDRSSFCYIHKDVIVSTVNMYAFQDKGNLDDLSKNKHVSKETRVKYRKFLDPDLLPVEIKERSRQIVPDDPIDQLAEMLLPNVTNPYIYPVMATDNDLRKLPKTYIAITEYDALRDEGLIYAERLKRLNGGGSVELKYWTGLEHGLYNFYHYKYHSVAIDLLADYLKRNL